MSAVPVPTPPTQAFSTSDAVYSKIKVRLASLETQSLDHRVLEKEIGKTGRELLWCLFQDHLSMRRQDDLETFPATAGGVSLTHYRKNEKRKLMTVFGTVTIERIGYSSRTNGTLHPLDAELNLPRNLHSSGIIERVATASARGSFEQAADVLEEHGGAKVAKRQIREMAIDAAQDFDLFYEQRKAVSQSKQMTDTAENLVVLSTDGKGIVMRRDSLRGQTRQKAEASQANKRQKRIRPGEKRQCKRMAQVATVYDLKPWRRCADEVMKGLRPVQGCLSKRPVPQNKRVWASLRQPAKKVIGDMFAEALRRDPQKSRKWVVLVDGNIPQLQEIEFQAKEHGVPLVIVLDIIHVVEYLWKAVACFRAPNSQEAEDWVTEKFLAILSGKVSLVAAGIRRSATRKNLSKSERSAADICANYLLNHKKFMHYDAYLAAGYPVGTGVIEGACRYLIKDRMDLTGARWGLNGAEAVLQLRALDTCGDLNNYWEYHTKMELARNHAARYYEKEIPTLRHFRSTPTTARHLKLVK